MTPDTLEQVLDITRSKDLKLKSDIAERTQKSILLGQDQYMSSDNMYRHLNMLENLVPKTVRKGSFHLSTNFMPTLTTVRRKRTLVDR